MLLEKHISLRRGRWLVWSTRSTLCFISNIKLRTKKLCKHSQVDVSLQPFEWVWSGVAALGTPAVASSQWGCRGDRGWCPVVWGRLKATPVTACGYLPGKDKIWKIWPEFEGSFKDVGSSISRDCRYTVCCSYLPLAQVAVELAVL